MRSSLFWNITQRRFVVGVRRFGTSYRSHLQGPRSPRRNPASGRCIIIQRDGVSCDWFSGKVRDCRTLQNGTDRLCRNVGNQLQTLRNIPEQLESQLHRGGSLKSCIRVPVQAMNVYRRSGGVAPFILNISTKCRRLVSHKS